MLNQYVFICLILFHFKAFAVGSVVERNHIPALYGMASAECGNNSFTSSNGEIVSNRSSRVFTVFKTFADLGLNWSWAARKPFNNYGEENGSLIEYGEILLTGVLAGLMTTFLVLSLLSNIRPYVLCSFWFMSLLLLYTWRSGYFFLLFPSLGGSPFKDIYFFVLQSIPVITYLITTKAVTVLQARDYQIFQKIFTIFLRLSMAYLALVVMVSLLNVNLIIDYFEIVQGVFWVFLGLLGIPSMAWLVLSSRKNLNFFKFQISFGLLFITAVIGKSMLSPSDFPSAFFKPTHLLVGIGVQLIYMFWLLLTSIFENQGSQNGESDITSSNNKSKKLDNDITANNLLDDLSPRELDIFTAYCNGFSYSEISSSFLISPNTVKSHLKSCYRKLEINSKVEAISIMNNNFRNSSD
jgi:DNA-binding CsgD family transcriptional regulator